MCSGGGATACALHFLPRVDATVLSLREGRTWCTWPTMTKEPRRYWRCASVVMHLRQISSRARERERHNESRLARMMRFLRGLTYYLSGVPKARPLEGLVSWRVSDAPLKGLIECASERSGARLRWKMAETDLHSVFVFQVRRDGKCFDSCWAEQGSSIAGGSPMCRETSTPIPGPSSVRASEIGFGKQRRPWKSKGILP